MGKIVYRGLGRRKTSVARVIIEPGKGDFTVNKRAGRDYLMSDLLFREALLPLEVTGNKDKFDIRVNVNGGGIAGQAGAIRLGISRALLSITETNAKPLKESGFLTRDPRAKERKKPGLRKARRAKQFSKR